MPFSVKNWVDGPGGGTPISAVALEDMETRLSAYTDTKTTSVPTALQSQALAGTNGAPSDTNRYVTDSDPRNTNLRTPSDASVTPDKLVSSYADVIGVTQTGVVRRGKSNIPTSENTSATTYAIGNLTTPDRVQNVVLPTDGLIVVAYQAIWQNTVANNARAAIFIGATQLKQSKQTGVPVVQEATGPNEVNDDIGLATTSFGLFGDSVGVGATTEVTTGQLIGTFAQAGVCHVFAAAGTYDISVQFKNNAAGTLTAKNRHLWVWTIGF